MSAIFGIVGKNHRPIEASWVSSMEDNLRHRGPNGMQTWQDESVALGHLMLHTTPESLFDKQPLEYKHWVVTADVRLDNRKELFSLLAIPPSLRPKTTDSLLIVMAFEKWGKRCPEYLVGDFAFAIWDRSARSLYCAKDHVGVRQLFYFDSPEFLVFASEIRAIANLAFVASELDLESFANYLIDLRPAGEAAVNTFMKGIKRLMPAHWLSWEDRKLSGELYWKRNPDSVIKFGDEQAYGLALRQLLEQAISDRMRTDFPVGITLSGGLDSSSVACVAARLLATKGRSLYCTSSVLATNHQGHESDERKYIAAVLAQEKNIIPTFVTAQGVGAFDGLEEVFDKTHEPVNAFYYMDEALSQSLAPHARVVLTGFLGDITTSNRGDYLLSTLIKQGQIQTVLEILRLRKKSSSKTYKSLLSKYVLLPLMSYDLLLTLRKIRGTYAKHSYSRLDSAANEAFISEAWASQMHSSKARKKSQLMDQYHDVWDTSALLFHGESCLPYYQGQEYTHPLVDKRIIEFLWASPPQYFDYQGWPRGYIRRAMEGVLPDEILWRKDKQPYSPDFQSRIIEQTPELKELLEAEIGGEWHKYLDFGYISAQLSALEGMEKFDLKSITIVHRGILSLKYLKWLEHRNTVIGS